MKFLVVCLCAHWCGSCRTYQATFQEVAHSYPNHPFIWVDVEDQADLLDDLDIDNFPSILIADDQNQSYFFGPITPHPETLHRLCHAMETGGLSVIGSIPELRSVVTKLWGNLK